MSPHNQPKGKENGKFVFLSKKEEFHNTTAFVCIGRHYTLIRPSRQLLLKPYGSNISHDARRIIAKKPQGLEINKGIFGNVSKISQCGGLRTLSSYHRTTKGKKNEREAEMKKITKILELDLI